MLSSDVVNPVSRKRLNLFESSLPAFAPLKNVASKPKSGANDLSTFDVGRWMLDVGCWTLDVRLYWSMKTTGPAILTRNLSMRLPRELRIKMNSSFDE